MQSQVRFNRVPGQVPEKVWEALVQSHVRFNRVPKKVPGGFGAEPGFGAELTPGSTGFRRRFWRSGRLWCEAKKVPEKVPGGFGAEPGQVQQGSEEKV